jgi:hypothetical protein
LYWKKPISQKVGTLRRVSSGVGGWVGGWGWGVMTNKGSVSYLLQISNRARFSNVSLGRDVSLGGDVGMADEPEAPPPETERRPSALDKLKKGVNLAAIVSTVGSSVDKRRPGRCGWLACQQEPPPAPPEAPRPPRASVGLRPHLCTAGRPRAPCLAHRSRRGRPLRRLTR